MTRWQHRVIELTKHMAEEWELREGAQSTIDAYTAHVGRFAQLLGKSLEAVSPEDVGNGTYDSPRLSRIATTTPRNDSC